MLALLRSLQGWGCLKWKMGTFTTLFKVSWELSEIMCMKEQAYSCLRHSRYFVNDSWMNDWTNEKNNTCSAFLTKVGVWGQVMDLIKNLHMRLALVGLKANRSLHQTLKRSYLGSILYLVQIIFTTPCSLKMALLKMAPAMGTFPGQGRERRAANGRALTVIHALLSLSVPWAVSKGIHYMQVACLAATWRQLPQWQHQQEKTQIKIMISKIIFPPRAPWSKPLIYWVPRLGVRSPRAFTCVPV